jgi:cobalt/nickel transport protein
MNLMKHLIAAAALAALSFSAQAHFGIAIPSSDIVASPKDADLKVEVAFAHPMEQTGMTMAKPKAVWAVTGGKKENVTGNLAPAKYLDKDAWLLNYKVKRPGVYQFAVEPEPYWEPAEDKFIVHYTKVAVPAFGDEDGWDEPAGLPSEIIPLTRPFGNWAGNTFQGRVTVNGKPVPGAEVEVEYLNTGSKVKPASDYHVTQVIKADSNGVFTYTAPWAGWWGFAALTEADYKLPHEGKDRSVEIGAVLWTYFAK